MKKVCEVLRKYREKNGITQTFIAQKLGKSVSRISAIERGGIKLTVDEFLEICILGYEINPSLILKDIELKVKNEEVNIKPIENVEAYRTASAK